MLFRSYERHHEEINHRIHHLYPFDISGRSMGNELQMDARARMAIRVFICLDCNGNYRYYCIFVLQKKEMVLTKTHHQS